VEECNMVKRLIGLQQVVLVGAVFALTVVSTGWATIINGDFEDTYPLAGWTYDHVSISYSDSSAYAELDAFKRWHWEGSYWQMIEWHDAWLQQSSIVLEEGQTELQFDATAWGEYSSPTVLWEITRGGTGGGTTDIFPDDTWQTYRIPLLDAGGNPFQAGDEIRITAQIYAYFPSPGPGGPGHEYCSAWGWLDVDNFQLVTEPTTIGLLAFGGLALLGGTSIMKSALRRGVNASHDPDKKTRV
jgi:hypothetical protein